MIRNMQKIGVIQAVNNGVEDMSIPVGHNGTICGLYFVCKGAGAVTVANVKAAISAIRLEATHDQEGGINILDDVTPERLYSRELRHGAVKGIENDNILSYDPSAIYGRDAENAAYLNLGCADLRDLNLRITFGASFTAVNRIEVYIDIDYNLIAKLGAHIRIGKVRPFVTAAGGEVEVTEMPKFDKRFGYAAIHIEQPAGLLVDSVSVVRNGNKIDMDDVPMSLLDRTAMENGRTPQADCATIDFSKEDHHAYFLPCGMNEFKVTPKFVAGSGAADSYFTVWHEVIKRG